MKYFMSRPKLIYLLSQADHKVQSLIRQCLPEELQSPSQMLVLFYLDQQDGITLTELASRMQLVPSAITGLIQRMTIQKLVIKKSSPTDARTTCLFLTDLSRSLLPELKQKATYLNQYMQQGFSIEEICTIEKWLDFLTKNLDKMKEKDL